MSSINDINAAFNQLKLNIEEKQEEVKNLLKDFYHNVLPPVVGSSVFINGKECYQLLSKNDMYYANYKYDLYDDSLHIAKETVSDGGFRPAFRRGCLGVYDDVNDKYYDFGNAIKTLSKSYNGIFIGDGNMLYKIKNERLSGTYHLELKNIKAVPAITHFIAQLKNYKFVIIDESLDIISLEYDSIEFDNETGIYTLCEREQEGFFSGAHWSKIKSIKEDYFDDDDVKINL